MRYLGPLSKRAVLLFCLFFVAFAIRVTWAFSEYSTHGTSEWSDGFVYLNYGREFADGDFFPGASDNDLIIVGPVMPLIVAFSDITTDDPIWPVLVLNCLFGALLVYVLFALGKRLVSEGVGYLLAVWSVLNVGLIRLNLQILKEPLVFLLVPLLILVLIKYADRIRPWRDLCLSALIFSILIHTDERFILYTPFILAFIIFSAPRRRQLTPLAVWSLLLFVTMVPWLARNYAQFNQLVIISPRTTAITSKIWGDPLLEMHFSSEAGQEKRVEKLRAVAVERGQKYGVQPRLYGNPERYARAFANYWQPTYFKLTYIEQGYRPIIWSTGHNLSSILFYGVFLPFYIAGMFWAFIKRNWAITILAVVPLLHSVVHALMLWPLERYRLPLDFVVVITSIWFIRELLVQHRKRKILDSE